MAGTIMRGEGPKYRRVANDLRARITAGEFPVGSKLPKIANLRDEYGVASNTIERAVDELRAAGLVTSAQGSGIYVQSVTGEPSAEFTAVMKRLDEMEDDVRQLREAVAELKAGRRKDP
jgi:DNA-binding GntR family transcriptional regulator